MQRSLGSRIATTNEVDECSDLGCCLLNQKSATDSAARCTCFETNASCEAEAQAQAGSVVVSKCPPPGEAPSDTKACIAEGQSCRFGQPGDCCSGTLCAPNAAGVLVCQTATSEDLALAQQCTRVAKSDDLNRFELLTPTLRTSIGELAVPGVEFSFEGVGPNGCLNDWDLTLGGGLSAGRPECTFRFTVDLQGGKLVVARLDGDVSECSGVLPAPTTKPVSGFLAASNPAIDLTFQGLACEAQLVFESYCVAGTFDFHIHETKIGDVSFEDQHLILRGVSCSAEPKGNCPSP